MTNTAVLIIYIPIVMITFIAFFIALSGDRKKPAIRCLLFLMGMILFWEATVLGFYLTDDLSAARFLFDAKLPFVSLASLALLLFTLYFFKLEKRLTKAGWAALLAIPLLTAIFSFTSPLHTLIRAEAFITVGALNLADSVRGPLFWVHAFFCYATILASLVIIIYKYRRQLPEERTASRFLLTGIIIAAASNAVAMFQLFDLPLDFTLIGMCAALILLYMGVTTNDRGSFLHIARDEIFHRLNDPIFIVNTQNIIVEMNAASKKWLDTLSVPPPETFDGLISSLEKNGAKTAPPTTGGLMELTLHTSDNVWIYSIRENTITHKKGFTVGRFLIFENVTETRLLIKQLTKHVGYDSLTGLQNRYSFEKAKMDFDKPEFLPLSVIFGDLDSLKIINDMHGHKTGDEYLERAARCLEGVCPDNGQVFRIGGDEFVLLLPSCTAKQSIRIMDEIHQSFCDINDFPASISLGNTTKEHTHQNLSLLVDEADKLMYTRKRAHA
ncbi:diguanylate cyclase [Christensenellaceae bacterium OttesenSCG-928-K19]|nr:diguanylate cyclase [Christensenellaceae bacterium OttesenSCG-928-K19]